MRKEFGGVEITSVDDFSRVKEFRNGKNPNYMTEREFGRLILDKTDLELTYQPTLFYMEDDDGVIKGTMPDYRVRNSHTGATTYIELTTSLGGKGKQRNYMRQLAPDVHYIVFYRDKLQAIQDKFPEYHLINGTNGNGGNENFSK